MREWYVFLNTKLYTRLRQMMMKILSILRYYYHLLISIDFARYAFEMIDKHLHYEAVLHACRSEFVA